MTPELKSWAARHGISDMALAELRQMLTASAQPAPRELLGMSEAAVSSRVMQEASAAGVLLFRNNIGVATNANGQPVRYGLANDSHKLNQRLKSGDFVGIRPVLITPAHVGLTIGQFVSREAKAADWHYTGKGRELAQMRWCELILSYGGDARFCNGVGTF